MAIERIQLKELPGIFRRIANRLKKATYRKALQAMIPLLRRRQSQMFDRGLGPDGKPWNPLTPAVLSRKAREGRGTDILVSSGRLRDSLTRKNHPDNIADIQVHKSETTLVWGTAVPYSVFHSTGTSTTPARPHIASLTDKNVKSLMSSALKLIVPLIRKK